MSIQAYAALWRAFRGARAGGRCDPSYIARVNELKTLLTTELADYRIQPGPT